jgi:hypothetical protein
MATVLAGGLALSLGSAATAAPPVAALKQFKVPTANSKPRAITNGSDGNRWFAEGTSPWVLCRATISSMSRTSCPLTTANVVASDRSFS